MTKLLYMKLNIWLMIDYVSRIGLNMQYTYIEKSADVAASKLYNGQRS
jgi:hypothetical protein